MDPGRRNAPGAADREGAENTHFGAGGKGGDVQSSRGMVWEKGKPMSHKLFGALAICSTLLCSPCFAQETPTAESGPPTGAALTGFNWVRTPDGEDFSRLYPRRAERRGVEGRVVLGCDIGANGRLTACTVLSEEPAGEGFAEATIEIARKFQAASQTTNGTPTEGGHVQLPISWRLH
jgi:TonB family protein